MRSRSGSTRRDETAARRFRWICGTLFLLSVVLCGRGVADEPTAVANDAQLPRYRLEVGQELVYEQTKEEHFREEEPGPVTDDETPMDRMQWRVVVTGENDDGSWRLYIRTKIAFVGQDGSVRAERNSLDYCDLHPDGSYSLDERTAVQKRLIPDELFCALPGSEAELAAGWKSDSPVTKYGYQFRVGDRRGHTLQIVAAQSSSYEQMHGWETTKQYDFDTWRHTVKRITRSSVRDGKLRDRRTVELVSVTGHNEDWTRRFRQEAERHVDVYAKWMALCEKAYAARTIEACSDRLDQAREVLAAGRDKAKLDVIRELYVDNLRAHKPEIKWATDTVKQRLAFFQAVPQFSTNWQAERLDGGTFRLADHRGKVLVLDFWGTNCEYCVLLAPQVRKLAAQYQGQDVLVVGMFDRRESNDREDARARSLIEDEYAGFAHLEANKIVELYRLQEHGMGYPTLLVVDQSGVVRDVQVGYTPDLAGRLRPVIDGLLSQRPEGR